MWPHAERKKNSQAGSMAATRPRLDHIGKFYEAKIHFRSNE